MSDEPQNAAAPETIGGFERASGIAQRPGGDFPLERWYRAIRDKPLAELSDEDLCRCCRQDIFPQLVVPYVIERIDSDPLAGELYDGEMLMALADVSEQFWRANKSLAANLAQILARAIDVDDPSVAEAIRTLQGKTRPESPAR
jgi:hypothetical protein